MIDEKYRNRFEYTCDEVINSEKISDGIGTLSEKTVHAVIKKFYEKNESNHEIKVGRYIADIYNKSSNNDMYNTDIVEVQTAGFNRMRNKLEEFLKNYSVTVVYPIPHKKILSWVDPETGEISKPRRSSRTGNEFMAARELYKIKMYLRNPNLHIHILMIDVEEYRLLNGWSKDRKKGSSRNERLPVNLYDIIRIDNMKDYEKLVPDMDKTIFDFEDYMKAAKVTDNMARAALNILTYTGTLRHVGKKGNRILYIKN